MSGQFPFGFTPPDPQGGQGPGGFDMSQLGAALESLGRMMQSGSSSGAVNWDMARTVARQAIVGAGDPVPGRTASEGIVEAVRLAELWLDDRTTFPSSSAGARVWSRSEWLEATIPAWQAIIEPIAVQAQGTLGGMLPGAGPAGAGGGLPAELRDMLPPGLGELGPQLLGMARQMGSAMFAMQAGQGLATLAGEVLSATDIGAPLTDDGVPTLLPANVAQFGAGLGVPDDQVRLFLAAREAAAQRLFHHVAWLRPRLTGAIEAYAKGIHVDTDRIQAALSDIDPSRPEAIQEALASGVFEPQDSPEQEAAKARLETLLALVEGWVEAVTAEALGGRLPSATQLSEAMRRRRAVGGPAEKTFATLVGLEMRPRRLREAAAFWAAKAASGGAADRDAMWGHPDLLPTAEDLDDVPGFLERTTLRLPPELTSEGPDSPGPIPPGPPQSE